MTIKQSSRESKITTRSLRDLLLHKRETLPKLERFSQNLILTERTLRVRLLFLGINFQLSQLSSATRGLMLQISIKYSRRGCRDLMLQRRSTVLQRIVLQGRKLFKIILRREIKSQFKNTRSQKAWWVRLRKKSETKKNNFSKNPKSYSNSELSKPT